MPAMLKDGRHLEFLIGTRAHFVSYNGVIYCLKRASVHQSTVN